MANENQKENPDELRETPEEDRVPEIGEDGKEEHRGPRPREREREHR